MNFLNRLKYYLIGVGLGILMVMAIFKDRKLTSWTPQNQVIKEIGEKELILSDYSKCLFSCAGMENTEEIASFLSKADVDFSDSDVKNHDSRIYKMKMNDDNIKYITVIITKETVEISELDMATNQCDCN